MGTNTYWAAEPTENIGQEIAAKHEDFQNWSKTSGAFDRARSAYLNKYGLSQHDASAHYVMRAGVQGELSKLKINHYGNLSRLRLGLATIQEPAWVPIATNTDAASQAQCDLASSLLEYYYKEQRIGRNMVRAIEDIDWAGEGFVFAQWDTNLGDPVGVDPETNRVVRTGDVRFFNPTIFDVFRPLDVGTYSECEWVSVREYINVYNLIAKYPDKESELLGVSRGDFDIFTNQAKKTIQSDRVPVFHWFHEKTDALPNGRYCIVAGRDTVLFDGPLPYRRVPVFRCTEIELIGSPFGYSAMHDTLGAQEVIDALTSAIVTNQTTTAVQLFARVKSSGINYKSLSKGLAVLEVDSPANIPVPISLTKTAPEVFSFRRELIQEMQVLSAINDVVRGIVNPAVKSGAHAALFDAQAIRANHGLQKSFFQLSEDIGTFLIQTLSDYAKGSKRTVRIVGEGKKSLLRYFTGEDLSMIQRVTIEAGSDILRTSAGKQAVADQLLQRGALGQGQEAAMQYMQVVKTGNLDTATETKTHQAIRIKQENEALANGQMVPVLIEDTHWIDIPCHANVLCSLEARNNPQVVEATRAHILEHLKQWRLMPPELSIAMGGPPPPPPSAEQAAPLPPGVAGPTSNLPEVEGMENIGEAQMPMNPATGERYNPMGGPEAQPAT